MASTTAKTKSAPAGKNGALSAPKKPGKDASPKSGDAKPAEAKNGAAKNGTPEKNGASEKNGAKAAAVKPAPAAKPAPAPKPAASKPAPKPAPAPAPEKIDTIADRLGIAAGHTMVVTDAPAGFMNELNPPDGVDIHTAARRGVEFDVAVLFVPTAKMLTARLGPLSKSMKPNGRLWIAFPKKGSSMSTDLNAIEIKRIGGAIGMIDDKICSIDKTWASMQVTVPDRLAK